MEELCAATNNMEELSPAATNKSYVIIWRSCASETVKLDLHLGNELLLTYAEIR